MAELPKALEVNAALCRLEAREASTWIDDARLVIHAFAGLKKAMRMSLEGESKFNMTGGKLEGHTPEHGDIEIEDKKPGGDKWELGRPKERVGQFRVYRPSSNAIVFHRFWASSVGTKSEVHGDPIEYVVLFDFRSLEPLALKMQEFPLWFSIPGTKISRRKRTLIFSVDT